MLSKGGRKEHRWKEEESRKGTDLTQSSQNIHAVSLSVAQFSSESGSSGTHFGGREVLEKNLD